MQLEGCWIRIDLISSTGGLITTLILSANHQNFCTNRYWLATTAPECIYYSSNLLNSHYFFSKRVAFCVELSALCLISLDFRFVQLQKMIKNDKAVN